MKQLFIVANWKANKTEKQTEEWLEELSLPPILNEKKVVICPPFSTLFQVKHFIQSHELTVFLGSQTVSECTAGAYTGEVPAELLKEYINYCIIGHSERRKFFNETDDTINKKIMRVAEKDICPILCISQIEEVKQAKTQIESYSKKTVSNKKAIIAFEPLEAVGSGSPDTPEHANALAKQIKAELEQVHVLYGGSVSEENVHSFTSQEYIDGVLVGGASLDATRFAKIIVNA